MSFVVSLAVSVSVGMPLAEKNFEINKAIEFSTKSGPVDLARRRLSFAALGLGFQIRTGV